MKILRATLIFLTAAALYIGAIPPAEAAAAEEKPLLDPNELETMMDQFREDRGLTEENFSLAYCYTGTGEIWYYSEDTWRQAASLFKLPMMMCLLDELSAETTATNPSVSGVPLSELMDKILMYSNNDLSELVVNSFGPFETYRAKLAALADMPREMLPENYDLQNVTSARFMMNALKRLYDHPADYPGIIERLKLAQPGEYFRPKLEETYEIAQKYGSYMGYTHAAGIIYTPTPFLLVVMTELCPAPRDVIADAAVLFTEYTLTLDERMEQRQAEEQAAAEEALRLQQEEEERIRARQEEEEQARREAEAAAKKAAEEAAAKAEAQRLQAQQEAEEQALKIKIFCIALLFAALVTGGTVAVRNIKRK